MTWFVALCLVTAAGHPRCAQADIPDYRVHAQCMSEAAHLTDVARRNTGQTGIRGYAVCLKG